MNQNYNQLSQQNISNKKNNSAGIIIGILVLAVVILLIVVFTGKNKDNKPKNNKSNTTSQLNSNTPNVKSSDGNITFDDSNKKIYSNTYETGTSTSTRLMVINISDNGEVNLVSNLSNIYGEKKSVDEIKKCTSTKLRGVEYFVGNYKLSNSGREYDLTYSCDFRNGIKTLVMNHSIADGAIIVVSAKKGITDEYSILLSTLNKVGVSKVIVYVINDDESKQSNVVSSIKSLISSYGYENNTPVVIGKNDEDSAKKFMTELEKWIGIPKADSEKPFIMPVEDVMTITGRGTVITGRIETGTIKANEEVEIIGIKDTKKTSITGIEAFRKSLDSANSGDNVGILLKDIKREEVERGQVLARPGTISTHTKFKALFYVLSQDEGGRHTPFSNQYKPQFYFRTSDFTGVIELPKNIEMVTPGDICESSVTLETKVAMNRGDIFAIREGGRTIGLGTVIEILD